jgi:hypothetical protein
MGMRETKLGYACAGGGPFRNVRAAQVSRLKNLGRGADSRQRELSRPPGARTMASSFDTGLDRIGNHSLSR